LKQYVQDKILNLEHVRNTENGTWQTSMEKTLRANQIIAGKRQAIVCTMFSQ
jgi:hypothetical protein